MKQYPNYKNNDKLLAQKKELEKFLSAFVIYSNVEKSESSQELDRNLIVLRDFKEKNSDEKILTLLENSNDELNNLVSNKREIFKQKAIEEMEKENQNKKNIKNNATPTTLTQKSIVKNTVQKSNNSKSSNSGISKTKTASSGLYFKNCSDARSKGYSRIKRGEPGYRKALDRDGDGIACE